MRTTPTTTATNTPIVPQPRKCPENVVGVGNWRCHRRTRRPRQSRFEATSREPQSGKVRTPKKPKATNFLSETGRRYYTPGLGRWVNRDPIGEQGGLNLLLFSLNSPTGAIDHLGQKALSVVQEINIEGVTYTCQCKACRPYVTETGNYVGLSLVEPFDMGRSPAPKGLQSWMSKEQRSCPAWGECYYGRAGTKTPADCWAGTASKRPVKEYFIATSVNEAQLSFWDAVKAIGWNMNPVKLPDSPTSLMPGKISYPLNALMGYAEAQLEYMNDVAQGEIEGAASNWSKLPLRKLPEETVYSHFPSDWVMQSKTDPVFYHDPGPGIFETRGGLLPSSEIYRWEIYEVEYTYGPAK